MYCNLKMLNFSIFLLFVACNLNPVCYCFENITSIAFQSPNKGILAAFGDFNSDKSIDIFQIINDRKGVEVLEANQEVPYFRNSSISCPTHRNILNVVPGDFNGDTIMDIMVVTDSQTSDAVDILVFWGETRVDDNRQVTHSIQCNHDIVTTLTDQPLILDYNGDMIVDFLGQTPNGNVSVWLGSPNKNFTSFEMNYNNIKPQKLKKPHSSAFIDLNKDLVSDIFLTGEKSIEIWNNDNGVYKFLHDIPYPTLPDHHKFIIYGQISFLDFNADGEIDVIFPFCTTNDKRYCQTSYIQGLNFANLTWEPIASNISVGNQSWQFIPPNDHPEMTQINLRAADFNMDGYPDFVSIMQKPAVPDSRQVVLLKNEPCDTCFFKRKLVPKNDIPILKDLKNVQLVALYDVQDDGKIDLIVVTHTKEGEWQTTVLKNTDKYDACFVKVLVISGRCLTDCPNKLLPYGTNQPGPYISYEMTKPDGTLKTSSAGLLSKSSYFSLQLPYCLFGLGQTPNFIETLKVTLPKNSSRIRSRTWEQIIPNSQIVIIPYPLDNSQKWVNKLFVTPSHLVIVSGIALLGTCCLIMIIIMLLHFKEKREDKREKQQEANRFHFDAM